MKNFKTYSAFVNELVVTEAVYIPSNIEEFAKRRGVLPLVKKIGRWAEGAGKRITGGTAIGKGYNTLILDLRHQGGEIRINLDNDEVTLHGTLVDDLKSFKNALNESVVNEGYSSEEKKIVLSAVRRLMKYKSIDIETAARYIVGAAEELKTEIDKGQVKK